MAIQAYSVDQWTRNILDAYHASREIDRIAGRRWYADARLFAESRAVLYSITIGQVADLISVLSPQKAWTQNLDEVDRFLSAWSAGEDLDTVRAFCTRLQRSKIRAILTTGDGLRGPKVTAFRTNIIYPLSTAVTVDSWAVRIALADPGHAGSISSEALYRAYAEAYRVAAATLGLLPADLQAITWVSYRRLHGRHHAVRAEYAVA